MEENNRKGPGIFYAVVGVATLVVAIIGATFAFFSASDTNSDISGQAATAGLSLTVAKVSTDATAGLIPLNDADVSKALKGDTASSNKMCVDKNGNTVCQVYSITVENTGTSAAAVKGTIALSADTSEVATSTFTNLKWQLLSGKNTGELATTTVYNPSATTDLVTDTINGGASQVYYVMVWISNQDSDQSSADKGHFTGTVTFNSADGKGISATFSA